MPSEKLSDERLPAFSFRPFDPQRIYAERIGDRKIAYLDNNIWISLRDAGSARTCRDACLAAVRDGLAIFPLSYAAVSELMAIPSVELRRAQADLMDSLSCGVTLRNPVVVFGLEAAALHRHLFHGAPPTLRRSEAFTSLPDYVGDGTLTIPAGTLRSEVERLVRYWNEENPARSLRWLVDNASDAELSAKHTASMAEYRSRMDALQEARRRDPRERKIDRNTATLRERVALFGAHVLPTLRNELLRDAQGDLQEFQRRLAAFTAEQGEGSAKRISRYFRSLLPSLEVSAQLHGARAVDLQRRTQHQDFWDIEHASLAVVYTDAFVSADGGLMSLLRLRSQPAAAKAVLLTSVDELGAWLDGLARP